MKNRRKSGHAADAVLQIHSNDYSATMSTGDWIQIQETSPGIAALMHRSRTGRNVRITVICHDTRLSGFGLEDRVSDQK